MFYGPGPWYISGGLVAHRLRGGHLTNGRAAVFLDALVANDTGISSWLEGTHCRWPPAGTPATARRTGCSHRLPGVS
jgi:hypothetical protein